MSRSPSLAPGGIYGYEEREREQRRTTPFYYATPHSEAHVGEFGYQRAGSRGPQAAVLRTNTGYGDEEDEDMNYMGEEGESSGSGTSTDPYDDEDDDSEMADEGVPQQQHYATAASVQHAGIALAVRDAVDARADAHAGEVGVEAEAAEDVVEEYGDFHAIATAVGAGWG
ncbi:hypothetical protein N0V88_002555 [Collariella sp. IMI 366227]|nr:hypothetical protein N0V88_002555 [Collariella sp. IMI 366227]